MAIIQIVRDAHDSGGRRLEAGQQVPQARQAGAHGVELARVRQGLEFGAQRAGLVFGWIFAAHQVGAAAAAYGAGLSRTLLLTYTPALYAAGLSCVVAAVVVMMIGRYRRAAAVAA